MKKVLFGLSTAIMITFVFTSCGNNNNQGNAATDTAQAAKKGIVRADWGETDGKKVSLFTLTNSNGA
ncbi:MAG: galactose-1-epimerase, partial [Flavisolibacter sp.]|nr:galactose-1-epimerase [Flavisolibacter sp.]